MSNLVNEINEVEIAFGDSFIKIACGNLGINKCRVKRKQIFLLERKVPS
jgi:hypothetical protein